MKSPEEQGYNKKALGRAASKVKRKRLRRGLAILLLLFVVGGGVADYLSRLPRERFAKDFGFIEKTWLGAKKAFRSSVLVLAAYHEDPKNSQLPIVELFIKGKRLDKLNSDLPTSGEDYQTAKVMLNNKEYKADVRYRGDSINHWALKNKSWRFRLSKGKDYDGMQYVNLNVPRVDNQISNWLGYEIARKAGDLLVPHADIVHFRLNRLYDGVRLLLEQPNQDFLRRRNLPAGKIFVGDITSEQIYGGEARKHLYKDTSAWLVRGLIEGDGADEMAELVRIIREEHNPYNFYYRLEQVVDAEIFANFIATLEFVGTTHIDETHNGKYYFNSESGQFAPIVWDTVAYFWKNKPRIDHAANSLFRKLLGIPEIRESKDRQLWKMLQGDLASAKVQQMVLNKIDEIRPDIYSFPLKLHANDKGIKHISNEEWEEAVQDLVRVIGERSAYLKKELSNTEATYKFTPEKDGQPALLAVRVASRAGLLLHSLRVKVAGQEDATISVRRRGLEDIGQAIKPEFLEQTFESKGGAARIILGDTLYSKRSFKENRKEGAVVPSTYVFEIEAEGDARVSKLVKIRGRNSVTTESFPPVKDPELSVPETHAKNSVWWQPGKYAAGDQRVFSGNVKLEQDLIVDRYSKLVVKPGTTLELDEGVSIVSRGGELSFVGTEEEPIIVRGSNGARWGVLAVNNSGKGIFKHVDIKGGSDATVDFVRYDGALSFHAATGEVDSTKVDGGYISARTSEVAVTNSTFSGIADPFIRSKNSAITSEGNVLEAASLSHSAALLKGAAFGTPKRVEREFKYSIRGAGDMSLKEVAEKANKALAKSVSERGRWKAEAYTNSSYYVNKDFSDFMFRDVYFDTPSNLCYRHAVSYRLRNRYRSLSSYELHVKNQDNAKYWPYRLEFQAKTNRKEVGDGFSTVEEARFEFRKESLPFSEDYLPPPPPWSLSEYIPYFQKGKFKEFVTYPAREAMEFFKANGLEHDEISFEPKFVLLTERHRQHLNLQTPWGSGPNPEQSYIISIDQSEVYDANPYLRYLEEREYGAKKLQPPPSRGAIFEIEIEFERNVSDRLDREINEAKLSENTAEVTRLTEIRSAFLEDQKMIMTTIKEAFADEGIAVVPADKSKYVQAVDL